MAKKFLTGLNLVVLDTDPATGLEGELYFNSSASVAKIYQAGAWSVLGAGGGGTTVSTIEPASPEIGDSWYKNDTGEFYIYDGTYWVEVNGTVSLSQEQVQDYVAPLFTHENHVNASVTYDDELNQLHIDVVSAPTAGFTSTLKHDVRLNGSIAKGQAVYVSSANGTNMVVSKASNASEATSSKTLGLLETGGSDNALVKVVTEGLLAGLDTSTANSEGDPVWLGTGGNLIYGLANKPYAPAHLVFIGVVTRKNSSNGEIFVKVQNGFELNEIHNVLISGSVQNNELLVYNTASTMWINKTPTQAGLATSADLVDYLTVDDAILYYQPISVRLYNLTALENVEGFLRTDGGLGFGIDTADYLTTESASSIYLTQMDASDIYLTQTDAENTYLTAITSASIYQPLDEDLTAIAALSGSSGFLKKNILNEWVIDSNTYLTTYDAGITYQPVGDYATIDGVETLSNKTMSSAFIDGSLTFNDVDYEHTISSGSNNFTINAYNNLYLTTTIGDIILEPDHFVKIYDEYVATQEWVSYQNYLTIDSASATYSEINHNHTLDSLSNVDINSLNDGDAIVWSSASGAWINEVITGGSGNIVTVSSTAPTSPNIGDGWYDNTDGTYHVYDGTYWVEVTSVITMSDEEAQDKVAPLFDHSSHVNITASYDDLNNKIILTSSSTPDLSAYLTASAASYTYLTQDSASSTYLTQDSASSTYQPIGSYLTSESDTFQTVTDRGATTSNAISITNTTVSTSPTTGALIVSGGVGIDGDLHVSNDIHIDGDINVTGSISGSLTYINVTDLVVTDPLIYLADSNPNDLVDIGTFGAYNHSASIKYHTGLIRDASDSGKWKLASNLLDPTSNVIDFTGANFDTLVLGSLEVNDGNLISSASAVNLFNQTFTVNLGTNSTYINIGGRNISSIPTPTVNIKGDAYFTYGFTSPIANIDDLYLTNPLSYEYGGTGLTTLGSAGQVLKVNSGATGLEWGTVDALPSQSGNNGKYLTTNGSTASWGTLDLSQYLTISSASTTYLTQASASTAYQPLDSDLTALAGLTSAANALPYFTGSGTASTTTLSSFGRSLIDDADASASRTTLGLGTMAVETASNYLTTSSASTTYATKVSPTLTTPNIGVATGTSLTTSGNVISHVDILTPTFVTNSYTIQIGDDGDLLMLNNSTTAGNLLIPTDASVNFPIGTQINIVQQGTGLITVAAVTPATTTINATPGKKLRAQWSSATIIKTAANTWLLMGDLTV